MSHMVIYRTNSGKPGFHQAETINEAIAYVERLRNAEGVETARIYRLEQVDFSFEPVYKVRVDDPELAGSFDSAPMTSGQSMQGGAGTAPMQGNPMPQRDPIRLADEPPIADPMGSVPGNPPPIQGPVPPPTGPPLSDHSMPDHNRPDHNRPDHTLPDQAQPAAVADADEDGDARRGLFGR